MDFIKEENDSMDFTSKFLNVSIKNDKHKFDLKQEFEYFRSKNIFLDCTLKSDGNSIKVHKAMLSSSSIFFNKILSVDQIEDSTIILPDVSFPILEAIVHFIYNGEVFVSNELIDNFLITAQYLQIKGLQEEDPSSTMTPIKNSNLIVQSVDDLSVDDIIKFDMEFTEEEDSEASEDENLYGRAIKYQDIIELNLEITDEENSGNEETSNTFSPQILNSKGILDSKHLENTDFTHVIVKSDENISLKDIIKSGLEYTEEKTFFEGLSVNITQVIVDSEENISLKDILKPNLIYIDKKAKESSGKVVPFHLDQSYEQKRPRSPHRTQTKDEEHVTSPASTSATEINKEAKIVEKVPPRFIEIHPNFHLDSKTLKNRPYKCECGRLYTTNQILRRHQRHTCEVWSNPEIRTDNSNSSVRYFCSCGRSYKHKAILSRHKMFECGKKRSFKCFCGKDFRRNDQLRVHQLGRCGAKLKLKRKSDSKVRGIFPCEKCGRLYKRRDTFNRHLSFECPGDNLFSCECGKAYARKENLEKHRPLCPKLFEESNPSIVED